MNGQVFHATVMSNNNEGSRHCIEVVNVQELAEVACIATKRPVNVKLKVGLRKIQKRHKQQVYKLLN